MENRKIEGNYIVTVDEQFNGMVTGTVTVKSGVKFINHGMICDDVVIEKNASLHNFGMVNGNVMGEGFAEVRGIVKGYVSSMLDVYIHKDAIVNGKKYEFDEKSI